jgi:flagellin
MGFNINTNIGAMNAHMMSLGNNKELDKSLAALSSGLRINKASDDASGLAIANQLRSQAQGLGQAISNANDGINLAQTADGALEEYTNIINTIRTKAIQASSDGQNADSRMAIQRDINKLLEEADNIAKTTSFNGMQLLDGSYSNKNFQIGAYSNETVGLSISSARTTTMGQFAQKESVAVNNTATSANIVINGTALGVSATGTDATLNDLAESADSAMMKAVEINEVSSVTGVTADANTEVKGVSGVGGGSFAAGDVYLNGVDLGAVTFSANDSSGSLVSAFNKISDKTGVTASIADGGKLVLTSEDGSNVQLGGAASSGTDLSAAELTSLGFTNIDVNGAGSAAYAEISRGTITLESDNAITINAHADVANIGFAAAGESVSVANGLSTADVTTYEAAQLTIKKTDHALKQIDTIRSDIGSVQNQLESTVRNISVTQVNVTAAESTIRDVDFAAESANLQKRNILAQSGVYALSQANSAQQNVMRLLQ